MATNNLKLAITTALDNAGIKATHDQIEGLEKAIRKCNRNSSKELGGTLGDVDKSVNNLRNGLKTLMKDIAIGIGAAKATGTALISTFQDTAIEGKNLETSLKDSFGNIQDSATKFIFGTSISEQYKQVTETAVGSANAQAAAIDRVITKLKKQNAEIDAAKTRFNNLASSAKSMMTSLSTGENIQLEREKLEHVNMVRQQDGEEAAKQLEDMYNVYAAQSMTEQELRGINVELKKAEASYNATQQKIDNTQKARDSAQRTLAGMKDFYKGQVDDIKNMKLDTNMLNDDEGFMGTAYRAMRGFFGGWLYDKVENLASHFFEGNIKDKMLDEVLTAQSKGMSGKSNSIRQLDKQLLDLENQKQVDLAAIQVQKQNIDNAISKGMYNIEKVAYDQYTEGRDPSTVYYDFTKEAKDILSQWSIESHKNQEQTNEETSKAIDKIVDKLDQLLELKQ